MIRTMEIITDSNIGGAGRLLLGRLRHSDRESFMTTVILPKGSLLKPLFDGIGIKTVEMHFCRDRSFDPFAIMELIRLIRKEMPDLVNCHGCLSGRIAARVLNIPARIYTRHCYYPLSRIQKSLPMRRITGLGQGMLSDRVIAVAEIVDKTLVEAGVSRSHIEVIVNGAEPLVQLSSDDKTMIRASMRISPFDTVVTVCGRLEECKGQHLFLQAARIILEQETDFSFLIVGGGSEMKALVKMAKDMGIYERCRFTDFVDDVTPYINVTDILVNCSIGTETSSLALSEGMSIGIPIVASDYGGNPHMVKDGENGWIYPRYDPGELSARILMLKNNKKLYGQMSQCARKRFKEEFHVQHMTDKTEQLYKSIYEEKKKGRTAHVDSTNYGDKAAN